MMPELIDLFVPYRYKFKELRRGITRALQFTTIHEQHYQPPRVTSAAPTNYLLRGGVVQENIATTQTIVSVALL
jgi:hypothetical protein